MIQKLKDKALHAYQKITNTQQINPEELRQFVFQEITFDLNKLKTKHQLRQFKKHLSYISSQEYLIKVQKQYQQYKRHISHHCYSRQSLLQFLTYQQLGLVKQSSTNELPINFHLIDVNQLNQKQRIQLNKVTLKQTTFQYYTISKKCQFNSLIILKQITNIQFPNLKKLFLEANNITSLQPLTYLNAPSLQILHIFQNNVRDLNTLHKTSFINFQQFWIHRNPISIANKTIRSNHVPLPYYKYDHYYKAVITQVKDIQIILKLITIKYISSNNYFYQYINDNDLLQEYQIPGYRENSTLLKQYYKLIHRAILMCSHQKQQQVHGHNTQ